MNAYWFAAFVLALIPFAFVMAVLFFVIRAAVLSALLRAGVWTRPSRPLTKHDRVSRAELDAEREPER
ncbi:hypothetical protein [Rathayibacter sp. VKM Ac-2927]|uniref:hypothetical protein n=1 Tax=Rathayibacter sp. VKM Ac-2927 TaxID=2929478 RepID=UPI001FB1E1AD|nr:hypothetical protein [Rathayibacter sp. VKM Ac-2927]MCJ1688592.1 hypothetical protein [Rathayibacter sp. VKM Ac-2927]